MFQLSYNLYLRYTTYPNEQIAQVKNLAVTRRSNTQASTAGHESYTALNRFTNDQSIGITTKNYFWLVLTVTRGCTSQSQQWEIESVLALLSIKNGLLLRHILISVQKMTDIHFTDEGRQCNAATKKYITKMIKADNFWLFCYCYKSLTHSHLHTSYTATLRVFPTAKLSLSFVKNKF